MDGLEVCSSACETSKECCYIYGHGAHEGGGVTWK